MKATQFTVAFHVAVSVQELQTILAKHYGVANTELGLGVFVNGLPHDWIVIKNDRSKRLD